MRIINNTSGSNSALFALFAAGLAGTSSAATVDIGGPIGWMEGVCYQNVERVQVGDVLRFTFGGHDVYRLSSEDHFVNCDFSDALMLAGIGASPFEYEVTSEDAAEAEIYFGCSLGDHCAGGNQKVKIQIEPDLGQSLNEVPVDSLVSFGLSGEACADLHANGSSGDGSSTEEGGMQMDSDCSEPIIDEDGRYYVSCLSPRATMTPGGVINNLFIMHYPYPKDKRVLIGLRTWEFVQDVASEDGEMAVEPVPINQLYVHHLSGRVVLGQGTEGIRRSEPDAPYVEPYGVVTGDEGENMVFHIIDLREVDDWLPCIECRCASDQSYLESVIARQGEDDITPVSNATGTEVLTGGVSCCSNCTDLAGPTVDYRMRYNVSYSPIEDDDNVKVLQMLTADISPVVGKNLEFDVPPALQLDPEFQKPEMSNIQLLEREMPFNELFQMEFFGPDYSGPDTVRLFRCVGHLHVAAIGMWLEDVETGEMLCSGEGTYGTNPDADKGFLTAVRVDNYDEPKVFPADRMVKLVTEYDATEVHTGVMGMLFIFVDSGEEISGAEAHLKVPLCLQETCDPTMLPDVTPDDLAAANVCEDTLESSPACQFGGLCDCNDFINAPESTGCGGVYSSPQGDIQVDTMCAKSCGCPSAGGCSNELANSPVCSFGGLCDCEVFVNAAESTGCGGVYSSPQGNININDVCAEYCDACETKSTNELFEEVYVEELEIALSGACHYSTEECQNMLTNLYSCGMETNGAESLDDVTRQTLVTHASRLTMKHSKLGDRSIHDNDDDASMSEMQLCGAETSTDAPDGEAETEAPSGATAFSGVSTALLLLGASVALLF
ncbi:MAG: hypothetical protein SGARI_000109 [Bacillariaceae sp.]